MLIFQRECRIIEFHRGPYVPISIDTLKALFQNEVSQILLLTEMPEKLVSREFQSEKQGHAASLIPRKTNDSYKRQRKKMAASLVYKSTSS